LRLSEPTKATLLFLARLQEQFQGLVQGRTPRSMALRRIIKELKDLQRDPPTSCSAGTNHQIQSTILHMFTHTNCSFRQSKKKKKEEEEEEEEEVRNSKYSF
jgi:hypothetical protein